MKSYNENLEPLPDHQMFVAAVRAVLARSPHRLGASARDVASELNVTPPRRLGSHASKGNWSGTMPEAIRTAPRLAALARAGVLVRYRDADNYDKWVYRVAGE